MKFILSVILLVASSHVYAQADSIAKGADAYQIIAGDLLKGYDGTGKKIAVADFSYSDGRDSRDGGLIAERITTALVKSKKVTVIERKAISKVFEELKFQRSGAVDSGSAKEIGKMLGADFVVVGTLAELPAKQIEVTARVVAIESGEILSAGSGNVNKDWLEEYKKLLIVETRVIDEIVRKPDTAPQKDKSGGLTAATKYYERGVTNYDLNEYEKAIADFSLAIALYPDYSEAYFNRGMIYFNKGETDKAIADFEKLREITPTYWKAYYGLGCLYGMKNNLDKAIDNFNVAIELNQGSALIHSYRGFTYAAKGDYDKAIADFSQVLAIDPQYAGAYRDRGDAYSNKGEYAAAIEDYSAAINMNPTDANAYLARGLAYRDIGSQEKAVEDYKKVYEIFPRAVHTYAQRAEMFDKQGDYDKAIKICTDAIDVTSVKMKEGLKWPWFYYSRGVYYGHKKDFNRAIADFTKALEIDPELIEGYFMRGLYYKIQEQYGLAIDDYSRLIKIAPDDSEAYYHRGSAYASKRDYKAAIEDFTKAIEIDPALSDKYFRKHYPWLGQMTKKAVGKYYLSRGQAYSFRNKPEKALDDINEAIKVDPSLEAQAQSTINFILKR